MIFQTSYLNNIGWELMGIERRRENSGGSRYGLLSRCTFLKRRLIDFF